MSQKIPSRLGRGVFQGLVIALVATGALYAYATVVSWPPEPAAPTGLEAVFVGVSGSKYTAALAGYKAASDKCSDTTGLTGSHICTADEIIHSYNLGLAAVLGQTGAAWINNGPPGYDKTLVNDCGGWKSKEASTWGSVWRFSDKNAKIMTCNVSTISFACCK